MTLDYFKGQTLRRVGVILDKSSCFSHGQFYVALTRVKCWQDIRILVMNLKDRTTINIVDRSMLDKEDIDEIAGRPYVTRFDDGGM